MDRPSHAPRRRGRPAGAHRGALHGPARCRARGRRRGCAVTRDRRARGPVPRRARRDPAPPPAPVAGLMQPRVTIPMLSVVDADSARTAPSGTPARIAMPILVDVRERHEFAAIRAPGALLYPTSSFLLRFEDLPRDRPIHVICQSGSRSAVVTAFLLRTCLLYTSDAADGMDAWERAGRQ